MYNKEYNEDKNFEPAPNDHILRSIDRMRRVNFESASTMDWFPIADFDVGQRADYFLGGSFVVEKRKD